MAKNFSKNDKIGLAQVDLVVERVCKELYNAGMSFTRIADLLNIPASRVKAFFPENTSPLPSNFIETDSPIVQKILYDYDQPVSTEVLIENEKQRYLEYSNLEKRALAIMNSILGYYSAPTGDLKADKEVARMASEFIKVTQSARQELIQKYAIDKIETNKDSLKIEFI